MNVRKSLSRREHLITGNEKCPTDMLHDCADEDTLLTSQHSRQTHDCDVQHGVEIEVLRGRGAVRALNSGSHDLAC